jgi:hypothetical protein
LKQLKDEIKDLETFSAKPIKNKKGGWLNVIGLSKLGRNINLPYDRYSTNFIFKLNILNV